MASATATQPTHEGDEEDYMSAAFVDPAAATSVKRTSANETSLQRQSRIRKEAAKRAQPLSRKEIERHTREQQESDLATPLATMKGSKLMAKLGYKAGDTLGKSGGLAEPIQLTMKDDRGGIGTDTEKKRKVQEALNQHASREKRAKVSEDGYRERRGIEHEELRTKSLVQGAMKAAERLHDGIIKESDRNNRGLRREENRQPGKPFTNVLWRGLERERRRFEEEEQKKRKAYDALGGVQEGRNGFKEEEEEELAERIAWGQDCGETTDTLWVDDEQDEELDEFEALEPALRLEKLVMHLREVHRYCFWCKSVYPDSKMDGCPGGKEEDHD